MSNDINIYQRIGETLASSGNHEIIAAYTPAEDDILVRAGFTKIGSMKNGDGDIVNLYKFEQQVKEVVKIVEVPTNKNNYPWNQIKDPAYPYTTPGIWYRNDHWLYNDPNKPAYTYFGTSTTDADWVQKNWNKTISNAIADNSEFKSGYNSSISRSTTDITNTKLLEEIKDTLKAANTERLNSVAKPRNQ